MKRAAACSLLILTFLCCVKCQSVQFVRNGVSPNSSMVALSSSKSGWSLHDEGRHTEAFRFLPTTWPVPGPGQPADSHLRRTRRQVYYSKNSNFVGGGGFSWSHYFTIPPVYSNTKESAYVREENMKRLKNMLEKETQFQFLNPSGLRISVPADNINIRIVDFRFKVNEEFRGNDGGHYAPTSYKRGGLWTYDIPDLRVQQGDKVYYWMNVKFIKEGTDVMVQGVLEITKGNPHVVGSPTNQIQFRPTTAPVINPPQSNYGGGGGLTQTLGGGFGGGTRGAFIWNHQFTIDATYGSGFTQASANSWLQQAGILKNTVQNMDFQFSNPTGLTILIPDGNTNMRIEDLRLKVNEEFGGNDGGHYAPNSFKRGGLVTYNVPQLKASQGDRIFYSMRVKLGREGFDTIVRGVLSISQGDPHKGANGVYMEQPSFSRPPTQVVNPNNPSVGGGLGGNIRGQQAVRWEHRFTINTTYNAAFTQESANKWFDEAQLFKNTLEKDIEFQFLNPTGLSISISGDNEDVKILAFNVKLNEEFRTLGPGNFVANISRMSDGRWNYYYPNLKLNQGDKVYYWMRVTLGKQAFDNIVKGVLEVKQGDPHIGGPVPLQPAPAHLMPPQPPSTPPPYNQYPNQYKPPNQYPSQQPANQYPPKLPVSQYPQYPPEQTTSQYPPKPPGNYYTPPPTSQPKPPPTTSPPFQYPPPTTLPPFQYPPQPSLNQNPSQPSSCDPTVTSVNMNGDTTPPCQGQILLEHKFNTLDGWTHQISIGGKNPEDEFTSFTMYDENAWVQQGKLYIKPTLLEDRANDSYVRGGELFLPGCTLSNLGSKFCHRKAQGYTILPPVNSARINSQNMISFRYGTIEIRAKLPKGDWIVPELWLEPTNPDVQEKIVLGFSTGNAGKTANQVAAGVIRESDKRLTLMHMTGSTPWYQGFHTFKLEWTPDRVKFFVDNRQIYDLPTDSFTVFSQEVYITLGVHAGGYRDFPDDLFPNKPWKDFDVKRIARFWDAKKDWYPTWSSDPTLQVESIRVQAL